jgi:hypothetical protein
VGMGECRDKFSSLYQRDNWFKWKKFESFTHVVQYLDFNS